MIDVLLGNQQFPDENLCLEMGKRGRRLAEKVHNWEYCEDRIESLYRFVKKSRIPNA